MSYNTQILLAAITAILAGWLLSAAGLDNRFAQGLLYGAGLVSGVFIALLKMVMIPLIFSSIAVGVANLSAHSQMRRVWITTLLFFTATATMAVLLGLGAAHLFQTGKHLELPLFANGSNNTLSGMALPDFFQHFIGQLFMNPVSAMANGNILAVAVFALVIGIALVRGQGRYASLHGLLDDLFRLMMAIVGWIMKLAPLGIAALLLELVTTQGSSLFSTLGHFMAVVTGTTLFHMLVVLPLLVWWLSGRRPLTFLKQARPALITAFATSSSAATLPITLRCLEEDMQVDRDVANFVAPLGAQLNMDGTALYEAAAALFIANLVGIDLSLGQQIVVCLMAMIASVGAPGIPSAGMVTMVMVLQSVGLPAEAIAILLPIDRLLDTVRTSANVAGDLAGSLVVQRFAKVPV